MVFASTRTAAPGGGGGLVGLLVVGLVGGIGGTGQLAGIGGEVLDCEEGVGGVRAGGTDGGVARLQLRRVMKQR